VVGCEVEHDGYACCGTAHGLLIEKVPFDEFDPAVIVVALKVPVGRC
jgi:hypothetical protein